VVGVNMGVDDEQDSHAGVVGHPQIWCAVTQRVDDGTGGVPAAPEQVGDRKPDRYGETDARSSRASHTRDDLHPRPSP
jgi:hypothetical protein